MWRAGGKTWTTSPAWQIDGDNLDPGEGEFFIFLENRTY